MRNPICLLLMCVSLLAGCGKDENNRPPDTVAVINTNSPLAGTVYLNGTVLQVSGDVADDNALSSVKVEIRNAASGTILYQQNNPTGNVLFHNFTWNWTVSGINTSTNAIVKVTATDRYDYEVSGEVAVVLIN